MADKEREGVEILERGDLYIFYRPTVVGAEEEEQPDEVQNLHLVLAPDGGKRYRLALIGREQLPDPSRSGKERYWGFIEAVEHGPKKLLENLKERRYQTKTRGERRVPAARPAGEGVYGVVRHRDHTHLVYVLELPKELGEVQETLGISEEASYLISIKNPESPTPPQAGLPKGAQAEYPKELRDAFRDRKFGEADPPDYLDYEGTQFILIAAAEDVGFELGVDLEAEDESEHSAEIMNDLRLRKSEHPVEPLLKGEWG